MLILGGGGVIFFPRILSHTCFGRRGTRAALLNYKYKSPRANIALPSAVRVLLISFTASVVDSFELDLGENTLDEKSGGRWGENYEHSSDGDNPVNFDTSH